MFTTLYGKLAAVLWGLLLLSGGLYTALTLWTTHVHFQEVTQKLNRTLAQNLVTESLPLHEGNIDDKALHDIFHILMVINPSIEVYLLDAQGKVLEYSAPLGKIQRHQVSLEPLQRFLQDSTTLPILGDDPRHPTRQKIFSVAPIPLQGPPEGYLYVVLASEEYDSVAQVLLGSYVLRVSTWATAAGLVFMVGTGLFLFHLFTRRLRQLTVAVEAFQHTPEEMEASPTAPLAIPALAAPGGDEIDRLGTTFQRMAIRIRQQMQRLQHTDTLRRELIANVSHDLRTPLAALQGYLETLLLKREQLSTTEQQQYLDVAVHHSKRLGKLVSELFELAKLEAQDTQIHPEPFSLAELVQDVAQKFQLMAQQKQLTLQLQCADALPFVTADIGLIERLLNNLIQNALQYTAAGGAITLALTTGRQDVTVQVMDTGNGIPPADLPHIFDRFYRARNGPHDDTAGGVGLGLAIAKRIVELHHGSITAHRQAHGGMVFTFHIPLTPC